MSKGRQRVGGMIDDQSNLETGLDKQSNEPFDLEAELAKRVGMTKVKEQVLAFEHTLALDKRRRELGVKADDIAFPHVSPRSNM